MRRESAGARALTEDWTRVPLERELRSRERMLVLFHAGWCPYSRAFLPLFVATEPEAHVPFAHVDLGHPQDPRWDAYRILTVPTLAYFEHGEELERVEAVRHKGLAHRDLDEMLATVDAIQEEPRLPKRMHGPRRY